MHVVDSLAVVHQRCENFSGNSFGAFILEHQVALLLTVLPLMITVVRRSRNLTSWLVASCPELHRLRELTASEVQLVDLSIPELSIVLYNPFVNLLMEIP